MTSRAQCSEDFDNDEIEKSNAKFDSSYSTNDAIEDISLEEHDDEVVQAEKADVPRRSTELKRTASNTLSRVTSRLTTHSLPDPGPPPDGGLKAWTQVAMGWLAIFTTWGWVNCFGMSRSPPNHGHDSVLIEWVVKVSSRLTTHYIWMQVRQASRGSAQSKTSSPSSSAPSPAAC